MSWAAIRDRMDSRVVAKLSDGVATVTGQDAVPHQVDVMVHHNLVKEGPDGLFRSDETGFTWQKSQLGSVTRGDAIVFGSAAYTVREVIFDDGYMLTAACMEGA